MYLTESLKTVEATTLTYARGTKNLSVARKSAAQKGKKIDTHFAVHVPAELIRNSTKNKFTSPAAGQAAIEKR